MSSNYWAITQCMNEGLLTEGREELTFSFFFFFFFRESKATHHGQVVPTQPSLFSTWVGCVTISIHIIRCEYHNLRALDVASSMHLYFIVLCLWGNHSQERKQDNSLLHAIFNSIKLSLVVGLVYKLIKSLIIIAITISLCYL